MSSRRSVRSLCLLGLLNFFWRVQAGIRVAGLTASLGEGTRKDVESSSMPNFVLPVGDTVSAYGYAP